jgi:hypothetical protein
VRWACAEELPKTRPRFGFQPPPLHLMRDGELVGKWTAPAGFPSMHPMFAAARGSGPGGAALAFAGEPDEDALKVQAAIYAVAREALGAALETWPGGAKELATFDIGLEVDAEGALEAARRNVAGLVLAKARWDPGPIGEPSLFRSRPCSPRTAGRQSSAWTWCECRRSTGRARRSRAKSDARRCAAAITRTVPIAGSITSQARGASSSGAPTISSGARR